MRRLLFVLILLMVPLYLSAFTTEKELFSQAESRFLSGNYRAAYESYDRFVREYPLSPLVPDAQFRKAVSLFRMDRFTESVALFEMVERKYRATSHYEMLPFWKGLALYRTGETEQARESLMLFLRSADDPGAAAEALHYLALAEIELGRFEDAEHTLNRLVAQRGIGQLTGYEAVLYGYVLLQNGSYQRLVDFFNSLDIDLLEARWRDRAVLYAAEGYYRTGDFEQAKVLYRDLLDSEVETAETAYRRLYAIAQEEGDLITMEDLVILAEERLVDRPEVLQEFWVRMGVESYHRGELELASHFLKKALNRGDMSRLSHTVPLYLSEIAAAQGDDAEAFEILEAYLEETENGAGTGSGSGGGESGTGTGSGRSETGGPGSETGPETGGAGLIRFQLGDLYLRRGEYQEALRSFRQYLKSGPPPRMEHRASYAAAFAEYRLGNMEQALSLTDRALGLEGPNRADALRLKSRILNRMGSVDQAAAVLDDLVGEENARPGVEQMKLYFQAGEHRAVVSLAEELREDAGSLSPEDALQVEYLAGLSHVSLKNYEQALKALEKVSPGRARELGLDEIIPSAAYYRAWSMYRLRMFERALGEAEAFIETFPGHQLTDDALFLAGWCSFSLQRYREAARLFGRLAEGFPGAPADKALFLQAQSLLNLDQNQQAADLFSRLYTQQPGSAYADDAMLAHANLLRDTGSGGRAAQVYLQLWEEHPDSPLADEALYYRGETLFTASDFSAAAGAFDLYLRSFPGGGLEDASLYWGGEAELRAGNRVRALELWGRLIKRPDSSFRPDALYQSAESYIKLGDYQKAAELYGRLADQYPEYAAGVGASVRQREISYMAQGLDQREAELTAAVSAGSGAQTAEGRRAMLELARLYLMERGDNEKAFQLLSRVAKASDPAAKQEAGILLGEYYYRTGDIERAGRTFFNAALENPANRDMTAYGLFKAAQMMKLAGNEKDLRQLVDRLKRNFPGSSWSKDAEKLLESVEGFDARGGSS